VWHSLQTLAGEIVPTQPQSSKNRISFQTRIEGKQVSQYTVDTPEQRKTTIVDMLPQLARKIQINNTQWILDWMDELKPTKQHT